MAPNGSSRKSPITTGKPPVNQFNFISKNALEGAFSEADKKSKLKLKPEAIKAASRVAKPGNWDSDFIKPARAKETPELPITAPVEDIALAFITGRPLTDRADVVRCGLCKRAVLRHKANVHIDACIAKRQEKQRKKKEAKDARDAAARKAERGGVSSDSSDAEEDTVAVNGAGGADGSKKTVRKTDSSAPGVTATAAAAAAAASTSAGGMVSGSQASKKRKAEDVGINEASKKKKKKDEAKNKAPKAKAPVDVERQCGVELPQGGQCARSLTCKSHSMGAKRAVPGRSAPYDKLLAEYQRKNQAKLQKAALENQAPELDDMAAEGPVDSEDEKEAVLAAIARSRPRPLFQPILVPLAARYQHVRLREMLGNALGGRPTGGVGGGGGGGGGGNGGSSSFNNASNNGGASAGLFSAAAAAATTPTTTTHRPSLIAEAAGAAREGSVSLAREMSVQC